MYWDSEAKALADNGCATNFHGYSKWRKPHDATFEKGWFGRLKLVGGYESWGSAEVIHQSRPDMKNLS